MKNIYYKGFRKKLVPAQSDGTKLVAFFNCAATLMTSNLQSLAIDSLTDYTKLISQDPVKKT